MIIRHRLIIISAVCDRMVYSEGGGGGVNHQYGQVYLYSAI